MNFGSKVTKKNGKTFSSRCKYNQRKEKIQPEEKKYSQRKIFGQKISAKPKFTWTNELYYIISPDFVIAPPRNFLRRVWR